MSLLSRLFVLMAVMLASLFATASVSASFYDPPGRVARLSDVRGELSYSPSGEDGWYDLYRNRPLVRGDRLWTDQGAHAELQIGSSAIRMGQNTSLEFLELNDRLVQVEVSEGSVNLRIRRMYPGQEFEVATPSLAFVIRRPGNYRIDVDTDYADTTVTVWRGDGIAYGDGDRFPVRAGDAVTFYGNDLRDYELYGLPQMDEFDRYALNRDRRMDQSVSLRYMSDDIVGYSDLDGYGSWRPLQGYGAAWFPNQVSRDWAPYSDGQWIWQEPWGWTWVDNAPWGFAPSHYGRWVYDAGRWGWLPGPRTYRPTYAPALVVFVGDSGWNGSAGLGGDASIGWFPLGPRDVYIPPYQTSREYFSRVNVSNAAINGAAVSQVYGSYANRSVNPTRINYANRSVPTAVTAVPASVFAGARPVRGSAVRLDRAAIANGQLSRLAPVAPSASAVQGPNAAARVRPPHEARQRPVFVRNAPPPEQAAFAQRQQMLQQKPGAPLDPTVAPRSRDRGQRNFRVLRDNAGAADVRAAGPRRPADAPPAAAAAPVTPSAAAPGATANAAAPSNGRAPLDRAQQREERRARRMEQRPNNPRPVDAAPAPPPPADAPRAVTPAPVAPPPPAADQGQAEAQAKAAAEAQAKARADAEKARADAATARDEAAKAREAAQAARAEERAKARAAADAKARSDAEAQAGASAAAQSAAQAQAAEQARGAAQAQAQAAEQARAAAAAQADASAKAREARAAQASANAAAQTDATPAPVAQTPEQARANREARRAARDARRKPSGCLYPAEVEALKQRTTASSEPMPAYIACEPEAK